MRDFYQPAKFKMKYLLVTLINVLFLHNSLTIWTENFNLLPRQQVNAETTTLRFPRRSLQPSESSTLSHFKLVQCDGDFLLVGARNAVYVLSLATFHVQQKLVWKPSMRDVNDCLMKGKNKDDCHNYIRVLAHQRRKNHSLICGTNAFAPKCREYRRSTNEYRKIREFSGQAIVPYDPNDNSTGFYLSDTNDIYTGTVSDFAGNDPLIYRKSLFAKNEATDLRTQSDDVRVLDEPNFVSSFADGEHIYFWYREMAAESFDENGDQLVYARVARVCKNDKGGPGISHNRWTSFLKARLNCSLPSVRPFYFNELQSTSHPVSRGPDEKTVVYAVFTTPSSAVRMSAICLFEMDSIRQLFNGGDFKVQETPASFWIRNRPYQLPVPRPGSVQISRNSRRLVFFQCVSESPNLPESVSIFINRNPLLHDAVTSDLLLIEGVERMTLTQIAVAAQIPSVSGQKYNLLFVGTMGGDVLKLVEIDTRQTILIQKLRAFSHFEPIINLMTTIDQLIIVSRRQVVSVDLFHCSQQQSCSDCVELQDPQCAWNLAKSRCVGRSNGGWEGGDFVQNIVEGKSERCPEGDSHLYTINDLYSQQVVLDRRLLTDSSVKSLVLIMMTMLVITLVVGFLLGFRTSKWWRTVGNAHQCPDRLTVDSEHPPPMYGSSPKMNMLMLTLPPSGERNNLLHDTLPKDYKISKVYI